MTTGDGKGRKRRRESATDADDDESKIFWEVVADVRFQLSPMEMDPLKFNAVRAAEKALSPHVMRYRKNLGGVLVAHRGVAFPDTHGSCQEKPPFEIESALSTRMLDASTRPSILAPLDAKSPFAHVWARANCLVFAPAKGSTLTGSVRFVAKDHISLRVWKVFNAVITSRDAPDDYHYKPVFPASSEDTNANGSWTSLKDEAKTIQVGSRLRFSVQAFRHSESGLITLKGSMTTGSGCGIVGKDEDGEDDGGHVRSLKPPLTSVARKRRRTSAAQGAFMME